MQDLNNHGYLQLVTVFTRAHLRHWRPLHSQLKILLCFLYRLYMLNVMVLQARHLQDQALLQSVQVITLAFQYSQGLRLYESWSGRSYHTY